MTTAFDELSLDEVVRALRPRVRLMLGVALAAATLAFAFAVVRGRTWRSNASFMPQTDRQELSGLSGIAAQFGVQVPSSDPANSPAFYRTLLQSRHILASAAESTYVVPTREGARRGTLADLLEIEGDTPELRLDRTILALRKRVGVAVALETGVVRLTVDMPWPELSRDVAARLVTLVQEFNRERRSGQAGAERRFTEGRLADAGRALREAEDALRGFQLRNRDFRSAPGLVLEVERMQREISRRQAVYNGLSQSYEQARLEEVRNTPLIAVIDPPELPARPRPRGATLLAALAFVTALAVQGAWFFVRDVVRPRWWRRWAGAPVADAA